MNYPASRPDRDIPSVTSAGYRGNGRGRRSGNLLLAGGKKPVALLTATATLPLYKSLPMLTDSLRASGCPRHLTWQVMFVVGKSTRSTGRWVLLSSGILVLILLLFLWTLGRRQMVRPHLGSNLTGTGDKAEVAQVLAGASLKPGAIERTLPMGCAARS